MAQKMELAAGISANGNEPRETARPGSPAAAEARTAASNGEPDLEGREFVVEALGLQIPNVNRGLRGHDWRPGTPQMATARAGYLTVRRSGIVPL